MSQPTNKTNYTLADIAKLAGVSASTASRALRDSELISADTRARVQAIAQEVNYRPNLMAKNLRLKRSQTVGLVWSAPRPDTPYMSDPFLLKVIGLLTAALHRRGYDLLITQTDPDDAALGDRYVRSGRTDGLIIIGRTTRDENLRALAEENVPLVSWGAPAPDDAYCTVGIDNKAAAQEAVAHLITHGRRRIALIGGDDDCAEVILRQHGYCQALEEVGYVVDPTLARYTDFTGRGGYNAMQSLIAEQPELDGVFACSDVLAISALNALNAAGRRVPDDVSVIGFDNIDIGLYCNPPLTTVSQNLAQGGADMLVEKLIQQIQGQPIHSEQLSGTLIIRQSCGVHSLGS